MCLLNFLVSLYFPSHSNFYPSVYVKIHTLYEVQEVATLEKNFVQLAYRTPQPIMTSVLVETGIFLY